MFVFYNYRSYLFCRFENFLAKKYSSEKRFGLEGCEVKPEEIKTCSKLAIMTSKQWIKVVQSIVARVTEGATII